MPPSASGVCSAALWKRTMLPGCTLSSTRRLISPALRPFQSRLSVSHCTAVMPRAVTVSMTWSVVLAVGAAEERGPRPGNCLNLVVAGRDFGRNRVHIQLRHMRMRIRVVHDLHAGPGEGEDALGVFVHPFPHEEEGRLHAVAAQDIYELGRVLVAPGRRRSSEKRTSRPAPRCTRAGLRFTAEAPTTAGAFTAASIAARRQNHRPRAAERPPLPDEMHYIP